MTIWQTYFAYYKGRYIPLMMAVILSVIQALVLIPSTFFVSEIFDVGLEQRDVEYVAYRALGIIFLIFLSSSLTLIIRRSILRITKEVIEKIRYRLVHNLMNSRYDFTSRKNSEKLYSKIVTDTERLDQMTNALIAILMPSALSTVSLVLVLFYVDYRLAFLLVLSGPLSWWYYKKITKRLRDSAKSSNRSYGRFADHLRFIINQSLLIKTQVKELHELEESKKRIGQLKNDSRDVSWYFTLFRTVQDFIISLISVLILIVGSYFVFGGTLSLGGLVSFYFILYLLRRFVFNITQVMPAIVEGRVSLEPVLKLNQQLEQNAARIGGEEIPAINQISIQNLTFSYPGFEPLFDNLNIELKKNTIYTLIGSNGVGKSTLIKLLLGYFQPNQGQILVNQDKSLGQLDLKFWRKKIGVVFQDPSILSGTLEENLTYGIDDYDPSTFSSIISLDDLIGKLSDGLQHVVSDDLQLSGGEKQKVSLIRALQGNPDLIILDEPSNHLDADSLDRLKSGIKELSKDSIILIISHHTDFVELADEVLDFENKPQLNS